mgnify:CR=1 FL=1
MEHIPFSVLIDLYAKGVLLTAIALVIVRAGPNRFFKEARVYRYGPLPPRFFWIFSKGELAGFIFACLAAPLSSFFIAPIFERVGLNDVPLIALAAGYWLVTLGIIPYLIERKIDHWY